MAWVEVGFGHYDVAGGDNPLSRFARGRLPNARVRGAPDSVATGEDEFAIDVYTPPVLWPGVVDVGIYLSSDLENPIIILENVFEYKWFDGTPCFIATAAYGTPMTEDINALRLFRDSHLLSNVFGTAFVDTYYRVSPPIAAVIERSPVLAAIVRAILMPIVLAVKFVLAIPGSGSILIAMLVLTYVARRRRVLSCEL